MKQESKYLKAVLVYHFKDQQRFRLLPEMCSATGRITFWSNCPHPSLGIQTSRFYDGEKLVKTGTRNVGEIKFRPSAPDTMVETVVKAVCALTQTMQR